MCSDKVCVRFASSDSRSFRKKNYPVTDEKPCQRLVSMGDSWSAFCNEVSLNSHLLVQGSEIARKEGKFIRVQLPSSKCKCGEFDACDVFFFEVSMWSTKMFVSELKKSLDTCCYRESCATNFASDQTCPEGDKDVVHACNVFQGLGEWAKEAVVVGTCHPDEDWEEAVKEREKLEGLGFSMGVVRNIVPLLCFDMKLVLKMLKKHKKLKPVSSAALIDFDQRMQSVYRRFPTNSAIDRKLFRAGKLSISDQMPLSVDKLTAILGYTVRPEPIADFVLMVQGALNCLGTGKEPARAYYTTALGCANPSKFWKIISGLEAKYLKSVKTDEGQVAAKRMLRSAELIPPEFMSAQWRIKRTFDRPTTIEDAMKEEGLWGGMYGSFAINLRGWDLFLKRCTDLRRCRGMRSANKVMDGDWKPCSTYETYMYGSCYSTQKKWKEALKDVDCETACGVGCGHYNHWRFYFPPNSRHEKKTTFVDNVRFKGRRDVEVADANEFLVGRSFDLVCSDAEVVLNYEVIALAAKKCVIIKVLPEFGWKEIDNMCAIMEKSDFFVQDVFLCGKLHNGEVLVKFGKGKLVKPYQVKSEKFYGGEPAEFRCLRTKWVLSAMSFSIEEGERRRLENLATIVSLGVFPKEDVVVDEEVIRRIPTKIVRSSGSMAAWAKSQKTGEDFSSSTKCGFIPQ